MREELISLTAAAFTVAVGLAGPSTADAQALPAEEQKIVACAGPGSRSLHKPDQSGACAKAAHEKVSTAISSVVADSVSLIAAQTSDRRAQGLERENAALRAELERVTRVLAELVEKHDELTRQVDVPKRSRWRELTGNVLGVVKQCQTRWR
jgi:hypothetical protein